MLLLRVKLARILIDYRTTAETYVDATGSDVRRGYAVTL